MVVFRNGHAAQTDNFTVYSAAGTISSRELAQRCEQWRAALQRKWLREKSAAAWSPRCEVFVHRTRGEYLAAVGAGGAGTLGSSLVRYAQNTIRSRRIDLLGESPSLPAQTLPHELTHVVLADHFGANSLPRWADEGLATLADTAEKQSLHTRDLHRGLTAGTAPRLSSVLFAADYPALEHRQLYYGYSLSLAQFFMRRGEPAQVIEFLAAAHRDGYARALRETYGIASVQELDRLWRAELLADLP